MGKGKLYIISNVDTFFPIVDGHSYELDLHRVVKGLGLTPAGRFAHLKFAGNHAQGSTPAKTGFAVEAVIGAAIHSLKHKNAQFTLESTTLAIAKLEESLALLLGNQHERQEALRDGVEKRAQEATEKGASCQ